MTWVAVGVLVAILLLGLWSFAAASPESAESADRARLAARAAEREQRLAATFVEDAPLVLVLGRLVAGGQLEGARTIDVATRQELVELLVAATGEELARATAREADLDGRRPPSFGATQHPLAGRIDVFGPEHAARAAALLERWTGEGRQDLVEALVEFEGAPEVTAERVGAALDSGAAGADATPALEAAALVRPLREALLAAVAAKQPLALLWLSAADHADAALATLVTPSPPAPGDAPAPEHAAADAVVRAALLAAVQADGHAVSAGEDGLTWIGTAGVGWQAWTSAREARGRATALAVTVEVVTTFDGQRHAARAGFAGVGPTVEDAARVAAAEVVDVLLVPLLSAAAPFQADRFRWEAGQAGDASTAPAAYEVHTGPLRAWGHITAELAEALNHRHPFHAVRPGLAARAAGRVHVVELQAVRGAAGPLSASVRVDGVEAPDATTLLAGLPWPAKEPVGLRSFVVLRAARG